MVLQNLPSELYIVTCDVLCTNGSVLNIVNSYLYIKI